MTLPDIEDIYPHYVGLKHRGEPHPLALAVVKFLESHDIMVNRDFHLDMTGDDERVVVRFRKKKPAKFYQTHKKNIRKSLEDSNVTAP